MEISVIMKYITPYTGFVYLCTYGHGRGGVDRRKYPWSYTMMKRNNWLLSKELFQSLRALLKQECSDRRRKRV
jgi:hypothetical protein